MKEQKKQLKENVEQSLKQEKSLAKEIEDMIDQLEQEENKAEDYLKSFDEEFNTAVNERIKETPLLKIVFEQFINEIYRPNKIQNQILNILVKLEDEISKEFTEKQKTIFNQWKFCEDRMTDDLAEQAFMYGYAMANQLRNETEKISKTNN